MMIDNKELENLVKTKFRETKNGRVELKLSDNALGDDKTIALCDILQQKYPVIHVLEISDNRVTDKGAKVIAELLLGYPDLEELSLSCNSISDEGAHAIADELKYHKALKTLALDVNKIGDAGAISLGQALSVNRSLTNLNLGTNWIGGRGAIGLAEGLRTNRSLIKLDLYDNSIDDSGAKQILQSLKDNLNITEVNLGKNAVSSDSLTELQIGTISTYCNYLSVNFPDNTLKIKKQLALEWLNVLMTITNNTDPNIVPNTNSSSSPVVFDLPTPLWHIVLAYVFAIEERDIKAGNASLASLGADSKKEDEESRTNMRERLVAASSALSVSTTLSSSAAPSSIVPFSSAVPSSAIPSSLSFSSAAPSSSTSARSSSSSMSCASNPGTSQPGATKPFSRVQELIGVYDRMAEEHQEAQESLKQASKNRTFNLGN